MTKKILALMTGGTIVQQAGDDGKMHIAKSPEELIRAAKTDAHVDIATVNKHLGANLTFETVKSIYEKIESSIDQYDAFIVLNGTDSMEEVAFLLDLIYCHQKPLIITGSMKPFDIVGYDGIANIEQAIRVASSDKAYALGVLVVMNDNVHPARYVRKQDSQLMGAFQSHPGPIAQIRRGHVYFYYESLPEADRFANVNWEMIDTRVPIFTMCLDAYFPESALNDTAGLIVAGMGAGSLSDQVTEQLAAWTARIPIVLTSRCPIGTNYDDYHYKGSREKYEDKGFILSGYEQLNPVQARLKLIVQTASQA